MIERGRSPAIAEGGSGTSRVTPRPRLRLPRRHNLTAPCRQRRRRRRCPRARGAPAPSRAHRRCAVRDGPDVPRAIERHHARHRIPVPTRPPASPRRRALHLPRRNVLYRPGRDGSRARADKRQRAAAVQCNRRAERAHRRGGAQARRRRRRMGCMRGGVRAWARGRLQLPRRHLLDGAGRRARADGRPKHR